MLAFKMKTSLPIGPLAGPGIQGGLLLFGMIAGHTCNPLF